MISNVYTFTFSWTTALVQKPKEIARVKNEPFKLSSVLSQTKKFALAEDV